MAENSHSLFSQAVHNAPNAYGSAVANGGQRKSRRQAAKSNEQADPSSDSVSDNGASQPKSMRKDSSNEKRSSSVATLKRTAILRDSTNQPRNRPRKPPPLPMTAKKRPPPPSSKKITPPENPYTRKRKPAPPSLPSLTVEELDAALPEVDRVEDLAVWARACPTLYNDRATTEKIKSTFGNTSDYEKDKQKSIDLFMKVLASHNEKNVRDLTLRMPCPETKEPQYRLILLIQHTKTISKMRVLNMVCCIFVLNLRMMRGSDNALLDPKKLTPKQIAELQYAPSSIALKFKHVFSWLKSQSVCIEQRDLKSMKGSYQALLKDKFQETLKHRPGYGVRKSAPSDLMAQNKIRAPNNGLRPFRRSMEDDPTTSGIKDLTQILAFEIGECFLPRGKKEPHALRKSSFELGVQEGGEYHGRGTVSLKDFGGMDKTNKLSLSNPWQIDHRGYLKVYDDPEDCFALYKLVKWWIDTQLQPMCDHYGIDDCAFFWRRAPAKILKKRRASDDPKLRFELHYHKNYKWGQDYFSQMIRDLAVRCGFKEAERWTMRSCRRTGLTRMNAGGCSNAVLMNSGRHKNASTNALYQDNNEEALVHRAKTLQYDPNRGGKPADDRKPRAKKRRKNKKKKKKSRKKDSLPFSGNFPMGMMGPMGMPMGMGMMQQAPTMPFQYPGYPSFAMAPPPGAKFDPFTGKPLDKKKKQRSKKHDSSSSEEESSSSDESSDESSVDSSSSSSCAKKPAQDPVQSPAKSTDSEESGNGDRFFIDCTASSKNFFGNEDSS